VYITVELLCCIGALACCISTGRHVQSAHTSKLALCLDVKLKVLVSTSAGQWMWLCGIWNPVLVCEELIFKKLYSLLSLRCLLCARLDKILLRPIQTECDRAVFLTLLCAAATGGAREGL
jgi:hypothetical protein